MSLRRSKAWVRQRRLIFYLLWKSQVVVTHIKYFLIEVGRMLCVEILKANYSKLNSLDEIVTLFWGTL